MALDEGEEVHGVLRATAAMGVPARATVTLFGGAKRPGSAETRQGMRPMSLPALVSQHRAAVNVCIWQCALKARIISGGGFNLDNCRLSPEAGERLGWVTGWVGASRQRSPWTD
jgi:hypothetical protein